MFCRKVGISDSRFMQHDVLFSFSAVPAKWVAGVVRAAGLFEGDDVCGS